MEQAKATIWSRLWGLLAIAVGVAYVGVGLPWVLELFAQWALFGLPERLREEGFIGHRVCASFGIAAFLVQTLVALVVAWGGLGELLGRPRRTGREPAPTAPSDPD
jgi:hypothetical protein